MSTVRSIFTSSPPPAWRQPHRPHAVTGGCSRCMKVAGQHQAHRLFDGSYWCVLDGCVPPAPVPKGWRWTGGGNNSWEGLSRGRSPADFDPRALAQGTRVELEHTPQADVAQRIAMDHLTEDPRYYEKLARMEATVGALAPWRIAQSRPSGDQLDVATGRIDAILRSCPTAAEIASIERDFTFTFDTDPGPLVCTDGGSEAGARLALINAFRCMKAMMFSPAIPLIGSNVYDWLKAAGIRGVHVFDGAGNSNAGQMMNIRRDVLDNKARTWADGSPGRMLGIEGLIRLIVHETAHVSTGKDHNCSDDGYSFAHDSGGNWVVRDPAGNVAYTYPADGSVAVRPDGSVATSDIAMRSADSSLEYGGAWAAQYYFGKALAKHSALTERERSFADYEAEWLIKSGRLSCGTRSGSTSIEAPPDTRHKVKRNAPPWVPQAKLQTVRARVGSCESAYESLTSTGNATVGATAKAPTKWTPADYRALAQAAKDIGTRPAYLLLVLYSESRLNTWAAAPGNHAVGLNQIVPVAGKALGMTEAERLAILDMSVQQQLPIVVRSFRLMPGKFDSPQALYQYNAAPATMSKGSTDSVVVYPAGSAGFKGNAGLDYDKDGVLTVGDLRLHLETLSKQPAFQAALAALTEATGASADLGLGGSLAARLPPNALEWGIAAAAAGAAYYLASTRWPVLAFWL